MSASVLTILGELEKTMGRDAVLEACKNFTSPPSVKKGKKKEKEQEQEPKEKKAPNKWMMEVKQVFEEMAAAAGVKMREVDQTDAKAVLEARKEFNKAANEKGVDQPKAMQEAARRKYANDPAGRAKYEANKEKASARKEKKKEE
jgi:Zn-finger nucleic acid-binding protein